MVGSREGLRVEGKVARLPPTGRGEAMEEVDGVGAGAGAGAGAGLGVGAGKGLGAGAEVAGAGPE